MSIPVKTILGFGRSAGARVGQHRVECNARRHYHAARRRLTASNFLMPAMSPTMTEGNISTWKIKEGK